MKKSLLAFGLLALFFGTAERVSADLAGSRPRIVAQSKVMVRGSNVTLGDIAQITATAPEHDELVLRLRQVVLMESPPPLAKATIVGPKILEAIETAGVGLDTIGYSIPNVVEVERAGRILDQSEILDVTRKKILENKNLDVQVREVSWQSNQVVPVGPATFSVDALGVPSAGKLPIRVEVSIDGKPEARFLATALVDDWRAVPVLSRPVARGMLIGADDVQVVRLNLFKQPADVLDNLEQVIGKRALASINAGETIRRNMVDIPPVIARGKRIAMLYQRGGLSASATGVALEDGIEQSTIRVKNDNSGKIVRGKVLGPDQIAIEEPLNITVP